RSSGLTTIGGSSSPHATRFAIGKREAIKKAWSHRIEAPRSMPRRRPERQRSASASDPAWRRARSPHVDRDLDERGARAVVVDDRPERPLRRLVRGTELDLALGDSPLARIEEEPRVVFEIADVGVVRDPDLLALVGRVPLPRVLLPARVRDPH